MKQIALLILFGIFFTGCSSPLVETTPGKITDTSSVTITCNAEKGNMGLMNFKGPVFVHVGLITDSSVGPTYWRYVKFKWGSTEEAALAKPAGKNKWTYEIHNIRKFFAVANNEKIVNIVILFRQGNCIDTLCKTLRNEDRSDIIIPVMQKNQELTDIYK